MIADTLTCASVFWILIGVIVLVAALGRDRQDRSGPNVSESPLDRFINGMFGGYGDVVRFETTTTVTLPKRSDTEKLGWEAIRESDPGFDEQDFRDRVAWMFVKVHHAISDQNLERVRDFTDDRALASLKDRIDNTARLGHVEMFKGLRIERIQLVTSQRDGPEHRVTLHIAASAAKCVVERSTGRLVLPDTNGDGVVRRRFTEAWTLARPVGASTTPRPPLHRCPYCGGPVAEDHRYACTYCGTDLRGPELEWTIRLVQFP